MIRIVLPHHLRTLAGVRGEVVVGVDGEITQRRVLDALESLHPVLVGTLRDPSTARRRPFVRFFACEEDLSNRSPDETLPAAVALGREPLYVVGAMAGG